MANPVEQRVEIVWPKTGARARPFQSDLQAWLDQGWQRVSAPKQKDEQK